MQQLLHASHSALTQYARRCHENNPQLMVPAHKPSHNSSFKCKSKRRQVAMTASGQPTAVITGCSTGIGRETAVYLAQQGWQVFAGARSNADLQQLSQLHEDIKPVHIDVTLQDSVGAAREHVQAAVQGNGLQLLMNNAGIGMVSPVEFFDLQGFRDVVEVNFMGAVTTTQAFIPLLRQGEQRGRIINVSSVAGHVDMPAWSAYCSSKHALESFSDCLRYELEPLGVRVIVIKPGPVATPIWRKSGMKSTVDVDQTKLAAATEVYGDLMDGMSEQVRQSEATAIPVEDVVQVIYEAATCANPKSRYHVGDGAALTYWAKRFLPDDVWQGMMSQYFGNLSAQAARERSAQAGASSSSNDGSIVS